MNLIIQIMPNNWFILNIINITIIIIIIIKLNKKNFFNKIKYKK